VESFAKHSANITAIRRREIAHIKDVATLGVRAAGQCESEQHWNYETHRIVGFTGSQMAMAFL
jgi:hypothetical protein